MHSRVRPRALALLIPIAIALVSTPAGAGDGPPTLFGGVTAGNGNDVDVYGIQAVWAPRVESPFFARTGLEPRLAGQIAYWHGRDAGTDHPSLVDASLIPLLRWPLSTTAEFRPFVEVGLGIHLLSHTWINDRQLATAFNFGSHGGAGIAFGAQQRWELAGFIHHVSNGRIKQPNDGLTYFGVTLRYGLR